LRKRPGLIIGAVAAGLMVLGSPAYADPAPPAGAPATDPCGKQGCPSEGVTNAVEHANPNAYAGLARAAEHAP